MQYSVAGEPALPMKFTWRKKEYEIKEVVNKWKETGKCKWGSDEVYLRKHWYKIKTKDGKVMNIYFERQARSASQKTKRWWINSIEEKQV